nr:hypothetical protein [Pontibacter mangrovi]
MPPSPVPWSYQRLSRVLTLKEGVRSAARIGEMYHQSEPLFLAGWNPWLASRSVIAKASLICRMFILSYRLQAWEHIVKKAALSGRKS